MKAVLVISIMLLATVTGCTEPPVSGEGGIMELKSVFEENGQIPVKYTCDGEDVNPPLNISGVPENAQSLVLIVDDPDAPAGTWTHWIIWNIPAHTARIEEHSAPTGTVQGMNDFQKNEYGGPCPPSGTHRYRFKLYALDGRLSLPEGATKAQVEQLMEGHILGQTVLTGVYSRE
jgi:Raf kinase inhibitor-like YbhB/YbcL family protein